jgi:hypothetical protein
VNKSLRVDRGDGSKLQTSTPDRATFDVTHCYASRGEDIIHATWSDNAGPPLPLAY